MSTPRATIFAVLPLCLLALGTPIPAQQAAHRAAAAAGVRVSSVTDLKTHLRRPNGRIRVTVLYGVECPISQAMFPELARLSREYGPRGIDFQAYSTDQAARNVGAIPSFLREHDARLEARWIEPWQPGGLTDALSAGGVKIGRTWTRPLVILQDKQGKTVWHGEAARRLTAVSRYLAEETR